MDVKEFLEEVKRGGDYRGQIGFTRHVPGRKASYAMPREPLSPATRAVLDRAGIKKLYSHQAEALDAVRAGENIVLFTGTASGKSLCYQLPLLETIEKEHHSRAFLLFPTKALAQDQLRIMNDLLRQTDLAAVRTGTYDGDTPSSGRRRLRDSAHMILTNPDMLHASILPQHGRWAAFFSKLKFVVVDEIHTYSGLFGSNVANMFRRFWRICRHYGSSPQFICASATIGNPRELAETLVGVPMRLIADDGSPSGARTYVFWNPPKVREGKWRSRRSANVEAHDLMAHLIRKGTPTIVFSKAWVTAELISRYVKHKLSKGEPQLADKVTPYRGGYLPAERREIEQRLFSGELLGVSATRALELGIDVGSLEASVVVGYPGTLSSTFQQTGRAGRRAAESLAIIIGLDTAINQYIMHHPEYIFGRPIETAVLDADNPYVLSGHIRCAAAELPLEDSEEALFGPMALDVLQVLQEKRKVRKIGRKWYNSAAEQPAAEVSLRSYSDGNVAIQDVQQDKLIGEVDRLSAQPIVHPGAIYMHQGDTYLVLDLDLKRNIASVKKVDADYYTQPLGGTDVDHIDHKLLEKPLGGGTASFGEVTAYFTTYGYEKIKFFSLDAISRHELDLPILVLETMAFWITPPPELMEKLGSAGHDAQAGLRGIGYATRMMLPLFVTCDTLDLSHSVGSRNSPWHTVFVYERYPKGLGFTQKAYETIVPIMAAVMTRIRECDCEDGCPCCVGKPLRQESTWNVERGEGTIPSKAASLAILEGLLSSEKAATTHQGISGPDARASHGPEQVHGGIRALYSLAVSKVGYLSRSQAEKSTLERGLRRRLERLREPVLLHPVEPHPAAAYPAVEQEASLRESDVARRAFERIRLEKLRKRQRWDMNERLPAAPMAPGERAREPVPGRPARDAENETQLRRQSAAASKARRRAQREGAKTRRSDKRTQTE